MSVVWTANGMFHRTPYEDEADLEASILRVQTELFGPRRIYLNVKRKIGSGDAPRNVPDGYLIDLTGRKPRLYVVEVELASHEPLRHIAVQILQFSLSFESEPRAVKSILYRALQNQPEAKAQCEEYAVSHDFRNLDHMLEYLVFEAPFAALVVIDEMPENLQSVLSRKFKFGAEVIELVQYEDFVGGRVYHFEPFLADLRADVEHAGGPSEIRRDVDLAEIDTVVVPAREEGFQSVFVGENRWYAVRIHDTMRPQIKYVAAYRVAPISAITHVARVQSVEPWQDTDKVVLNFAEPAREIGPLPLVKGGKIKALQSLRYTSYKGLESAKTLDDVWS